MWSGQRRAGGKRAAWFLLCAVLTVAPWTLRNWIAFRAFVPVSTSGGLALFQGNARLSRQEVYDRYEAVHGRIEQYRFARREGWKAIAQRQPTWAIEKLRDQMPNFWEADSLALIHIKRGAYGDVGPATAVAAAVVVLAPYLAVLAAFVVGATLTPLDRTRGLLLGFLVGYNALHVSPTASPAIAFPRCRSSSSSPRRDTWVARWRPGCRERRSPVAAAALCRLARLVPRPRLPHEPRPSRLRPRGPRPSPRCRSSRPREPPPVPAARHPLRGAGPRAVLAEACGRPWTATPRSSASWPGMSPRNHDVGATVRLAGRGLAAAPFVAVLGPHRGGAAPALLPPRAGAHPRGVRPRARPRSARRPSRRRPPGLPAALLPAVVGAAAAHVPRGPAVVRRAARPGRPYRGSLRDGRPPPREARLVGSARRPRALDTPHDGRGGRRVPALAVAARPRAGARCFSPLSSPLLVSARPLVVRALRTRRPRAWSARRAARRRWRST